MIPIGKKFHIYRPMRSIFAGSPSIVVWVVMFLFAFYGIPVMMAVLQAIDFFLQVTNFILDYWYVWAILGGLGWWGYVKYGEPTKEGN